MSANPETMFGSTGREWRKAAAPGRPQARSNQRRPPAASGSAERLSQKSLSRPPEGSTRGHTKEPVEELGYGRCDPEGRNRIAYYARNACGSENPSKPRVGRPGPSKQPQTPSLLTARDPRTLCS